MEGKYELKHFHHSSHLAAWFWQRTYCNHEFVNHTSEHRPYAYDKKETMLLSVAKKSRSHFCCRQCYTQVNFFRANDLMSPEFKQEFDM